MLKSFSISNFRSINDAIQLSFEPIEKFNEATIHLTTANLLKTAIIYGPNASGKTNIIRALHFLRNFILHPPKDKNQPIALFPFRFTQTPSNKTSFRVEFISNNFHYQYCLEHNNEKVLIETIKFKTDKKGERYKYIFDRKNDEWKWNDRHLKLKEQEKEHIKINTLPNTSILSGYSRLNLNIEHLENVLNFFKRILPPIFPSTDLVGFVLNKIENKVIEEEEIIALLQSADFSINHFIIDEQEIEQQDIIQFLQNFGGDIDKTKVTRIEILFQHFQKYVLPFKDESAGTQRFYQLAAFLALLAKNSYILPIDEIESSLHPDLVKFFLFIFLTHSKSSQLILTTHMRELLAERELLRPDCIWFCEKNEDGSTELFSAGDFEEIKPDTPLYDYYKLGRLGSKPNIRYLHGIIHGKKK